MATKENSERAFLPGRQRSRLKVSSVLEMYIKTVVLPLNIPVTVSVRIRERPLEHWGGGGAGVFLEINIFVVKMGEINCHKAWWKYSLSWGEQNKASHFPCEIKNGLGKTPAASPQISKGGSVLVFRVYCVTRLTCLDQQPDCCVNW